MIMLSFCILCILFNSCISLENEYFQVDITNWQNYDTLTSELKTRYKPTWESLDNRPLPTWYDEAKFGIFLHWGVFSVPSFGSEWFWHSWRERKDLKYLKFMKERYPPRFTYQDFGPEFTAEFFDPAQWSELFEASGAKYIVLTSKHHEGYTLWPSSYSFSWNAMDVGPRKDLIGELAAAVRKTKVKFGLYHSLYEWFNPLYLKDKENNFTTNTFVTNKIMPELYELVEKYKPAVVWSDGDWEASDTYWKSKEFLSWLYNDSPVKDVVVANDRWGRNIPCHHGDIYTCTDRYNPGVLIKHKWENCMTIDKKSWGFRRNAVLSEYFTLPDLVKELVTTVSCGGNLLMNVGPSKDGTIAPIFEERLRGMGAWLKTNGEAIYNTIPWVAQNDTLTGTVWYTQSKTEKNVYASILNWPEDNILHLGSVMPSENTKITLLGFQNQVKWVSVNNNLLVYLPVEAHQGQPGWVLKIKQ